MTHGFFDRVERQTSDAREAAAAETLTLGPNDDAPDRWLRTGASS